jgi:hypothetical protein
MDEATLKPSIHCVHTTTEPPSSLNNYRCTISCHPQTPIGIHKLARITESYIKDEDSESPPTLSIVQLQQKISTSSSIKRKQGYIAKVRKAHATASKAHDNLGIERCVIKAQNDNGATHSITNNHHMLQQFQCTPPKPVSGITKDDIVLYATGIGYLPIQSDEGDVILTECLYSEQAEGKLVSAIALEYKSIYVGWSMYANTSEENGYLQLHHHDGINHATFTMYMEDQLWYHHLHQDTDLPPMTAKVQKMSALSEYELWYHHLGHPGSAVLERMHKYARGAPKLRTPDFYKCQSCTLDKIRKDSSTSTRSTKKSTPIQPTERIHPGQHLHMDFGFV